RTVYSFSSTAIATTEIYTLSLHDALPIYLLCTLDMWARADISDNAVFNGNLEQALTALTMPTLVMPSTTDQYFLEEESAADAARMPGAIYQPLHSDWGHCAGGPGREAVSMGQLFSALRQLLAL